jgi:methylenetetrahydrofolate dehydrogenase (NADP+)/methenyltetrahydrofolate cyclohydrolase
MNKIILDGKLVAQEIINNLKKRIESLKDKDIVPCLATILVGNNPSSETYVKMKGNACKRIGMKSIRIHLPEEIETQELIEAIEKLNNDETVHGILLQHPVPSHIDERMAFEAIDLKKDVDGVTSTGYGQTALGFGEYPSCTPAAILKILKYYQMPIEGKHAVVVGRSSILGKPVSALLLNENATVTTCHSKTTNLPDILKQADIVVAAVGKSKFIQGEWLKIGSIVLDAGYNKGNIGDIDYQTCYEVAGAITPVPGGVGPVTIATLMKHTVESAEQVLSRS